MVQQIISSNDVGMGTRVHLGSTDDVFVGAGVLVGSTDGTAIYGEGNDHFAHINGEVFGLMSGVVLGNAASDSGQRLTIGANGLVSAVDGAAVRINGTDSLVENHGTIFGAAGGLGMFGAGGTGTTSMVKNYGTIEGSEAAILRSPSSGEQLFIANYGVIRSDKFAFVSGGAVATEIIYNEGTIEGDLFFGAGDDYYSGKTGTLIGSCKGEAGFDGFFGGELSDNFHGGDDADELAGNGGDDGLYGDAGDDDLSGGAGDDVLDGGTGEDDMRGGAGNDIYYFDNAGDFLSEQGGGGMDFVWARADLNLSNPAKGVGAIENVSATGGNLDIDITGNGVRNVLFGAFGDNVLRGLGGRDTLRGWDGNDTLSGGLGRDMLTGDDGQDRFVFDVAPVAANRDTIVDFSAKDDVMRLENKVFKALGKNGVLKASFFQLGTAADDADDHIIYNKATGALSYDADGDGVKAQIQFATLQNKAAITNADFFVI